MGRRVTQINSNKLNWKIPVGIIVLFGLVLAGSFWWESQQEQKAVRALVIEDQDLGSIHDGTYVGSYEYGGFTYVVSVTVQSYRITEINIEQNRTTKHAKMAEGVVQKVLEKGNVNVDVVAGATTTSKALLKAIEQALACNT